MLSVRPSRIPNAGMGLFANKNIPANFHLGEYVGRRTRTHPGGDYVWELVPDSRLSHKAYIDAARNERCLLRYVNGAKTKKQARRINVAAYQYEGRLYYETIRPIRKDEELLMDYGPRYW